MAFWARAFRIAGRLAPLVLVVLAVASCGGTSEQYPQSTLHPKSDFTRMLDGVFMTTVWWALLVFVLVEGALVWAILRYRGKPGDAEPAQVHGNTTLEIVWTAIPALILAMIAVPTVRAIFQTYEVPKGDALEVEVIGHQWWWEFRYPQYGVVTANELHVPAGRMVTLKMSTVDVLHAFMLPQLAGKRDLFQQRVNTLWFRADSSGYYSGQCAEFCGIQHGAMRFHVAATTPAEFDAFIAGLRRPRTPGGAPAAPAPAAAATDTTASMGGQAGGQGGRGADGQIGAGAQAPAGQMQEQTPIGPVPSDSTSPAGQGAKLFVQRGCPACHVLDATSKAKMVGPNLANVGSRRYIGAGVALNNDENLARWIQNPHDMKVGVTMPNMGLTSEQARAVAAFLRTLK